jgi:hypothetical protein
MKSTVNRRSDKTAVLDESGLVIELRTCNRTPVKRTKKITRNALTNIGRICPTKYQSKEMSKAGSIHPARLSE